MISRLKQTIKLIVLRNKYKKCIIKSNLISADVQLEPYVKIYNNVSIGHNCKLGMYSYINPNSYIDNDTQIGRYCSISRNVMIGLGNHDMNAITTHPIGYSKEWNEYINSDVNINGNTIIENDVWIGAGAIILNGLHIGNGSVIAAGSVVTKDVPDYAVVAGVPARVIKNREKKSVNGIFEWWKLPDSELKQFFAEYNNNLE